MKKRKRINLIVESCRDCPYADYDPSYTCSRDSGYDCSHYEAPFDNRIVDDNGPYRSTKWPEIPAWCPLKDEVKLPLQKWVDEYYRDMKEDEKRKEEREYNRFLELYEKFKYHIPE